MTFNEKRMLGKTGLIVGRLGISSSYGAKSDAFEEAFERGCNYFTWNTFIKGRSKEMRNAIRNIVKKGERDKMVLATYNYSHSSFLGELFFKRGLKALGTDYVDVLIMGYYNQPPSRRLMDNALKLKENGMVRYLAVSSHNRKIFGKLEEEGLFDIYHLRYNAANRGAENDVFPLLKTEKRTGIVSFTATRWGQLLNPKKMPVGEKVPTAADCYRFVLNNQNVDVCMTGTQNIEQMKENLKILDMGPLTTIEMEWMRKIGDHIYGKK